ncbi:sulfurtransferase [Sansalvadorimonas sp. 2012CJ34-2]|uniref:Sulfurtransferase n=1 Tax=Parendozoicomonas callyspongiae TaxID=2942213 RepID=A0ABT0PH10_9GAMM|nr:sulfurtransferase [Sansalvadorimonas sp. 2012CJ34-2]MCL6270296.1 sulfurtransferase [Sansalvadorimonas sp. 2012CJ34-2]
MNKLLAGAVLGIAVAGATYNFVFKTPEVIKVEVKAEKNQQYFNPDIVITPQQVQAMLAAGEDVVLIDISKQADFLAKGHIEGAQQIWRPEMQADKGEYGFGGMRATREKMAELLGSLGVTSNTTVIPYDASNNYDAARMWWLLDMYGHSKVQLIDGGYQGWKAAGLDMVHTESAKREATTYQFPWAENDRRLASIEEVQDAIKNKSAVIIDARSLKEHTGEKIIGGVARGGRIPGSVLVDYSNTLDAGKNFKAIEELVSVYKAAGVTPDTPIITYCHSSIRSAHTTFVLTQLMGFQNVKNYDGAWIEWSQASNLPVESGDAVTVAGTLASL